MVTSRTDIEKAVMEEAARKGLITSSQYMEYQQRLVQQEAERQAAYQKYDQEQTAASNKEFNDRMEKTIATIKIADDNNKEEQMHPSQENRFRSIINEIHKNNPQLTFDEIMADVMRAFTQEKFGLGTYPVIHNKKLEFFNNNYTYSKFSSGGMINNGYVGEGYKEAGSVPLYSKYN